MTPPPSPPFGRRALLSAAATAGATLLAGARDAAAADGNDLLAELRRARARAKSLEARFVQTRTMRLMKTTLRATGRIVVRAPDRFRYDVDPPDRATYWVVPEGIAYLDARTGKAVLAPRDHRALRAMSELRGLFLGDLAALEPRYTLAATRQADRVVLAGTSRAPKETPLASFRLELAPDLVRPLAAHFAEGAKDFVDLELSQVVVDGPVDDALFRLPR